MLACSGCFGLFTKIKKRCLRPVFYFRCYLHHNLNWNNTHLYSSAKPLCNVPSSVFWFVNFCFLSFLHRTSIQKWKKIWFCYAHKWIGTKEMSEKISKSLCRNLFIGAITQIRAVYKDNEILVTLKSCITLPFEFSDSQHKISIALWLSYLWKHFLLIWQKCKYYKCF